ncbi:MAG: hypothetical protein J5950_09680 [Clostridia bacterium]|nr:hypothetical protein [Clostridia bacterium]
MWILISFAVIIATAMPLLLLPAKIVTKDIRLIEENYYINANGGTKMPQWSIIVLYVLYLLTVPAFFYPNIFLEDLLGPGTGIFISVIAIAVIIMLCALIESVVLRRSREKHRAMPWILAAINLFSAAVLLGLFYASSAIEVLLSDLLENTNSTVNKSWYGIGIVIAGIVIVLHLALLVKELVFRVVFGKKLDLLARRLLFIGANLLVVGLHLILIRFYEPSDLETPLSVVYAFLNTAALIVSVLLGQFEFGISPKKLFSRSDPYSQKLDAGNMPEKGQFSGPDRLSGNYK